LSGDVVLTAVIAERGRRGSRRGLKGATTGGSGQPPRVSDQVCGQDSAAAPLAQGGRSRTGSPAASRGRRQNVSCALSSRASPSSLAYRPDSPSGRGPIGSQGHARPRVMCCRPLEGVVVQQRRGLAAWRWQTRRGTGQRTDAAARDARFCRCSVLARGDGRSGLGSPLPRRTGGGHRGAGAGPRVTADQERPVGQPAASPARRRFVTTTSARRT